MDFVSKRPLATHRLLQDPSAIFQHHEGPTVGSSKTPRALNQYGHGLGTGSGVSIMETGVGKTAVYNVTKSRQVDCGLEEDMQTISWRELFTVVEERTAETL